MTEPRNLTLEAAIADDPDDRQAYLVYADWLEEHGHPRAALIRAHVAEADPMQPGKKRPAKDLFAKHPRLLLGPLAKLDTRTLDWKFGFVRSVRIHDRDTQMLLHHPSARLLLDLAIGEVTTALAAIVAAPPIALRTLSLHLGAGAEPVDVGALCAVLPRLRSLAIYDGTLAPLAWNLPSKLERLSLQHRGESDLVVQPLPPELVELALRGRFALDAISLPLTSLILVGPNLPALDLPLLHKLHLQVHSIDDLARLVAAPLPALVELELVETTIDDDASFERLLAAPFAAQLTYLSLATCSLPEGAGEALAREGVLPNLKKLVLEDSTLDDDDIRDAIFEARSDLMIDGEREYDRYNRDPE